jgi:hypothetical protein
MTPDIFYGNYARDPQGRLMRLGGFRDCVSIFGSQRTFDVNGAEPALLMAIGMSAEGAQQVVRRRRIAPIRSVNELTEMAPLLGPAVRRLQVGGNTIYTFRSTARLRLPNGSFSDVRRTVAAQVKFLKPEYIPRYHLIRWYDNVTSEVAQWQ